MQQRKEKLRTKKDDEFKIIALTTYYYCLMVYRNTKSISEEIFISPCFCSMQVVTTYSLLDGRRGRDFIRWRHTVSESNADYYKTTATPPKKRQQQQVNYPHLADLEEVNNDKRLGYVDS